MSDAPKRKVISATEVAARLEKVEMLLAACTGTRTVETQLAAEWGVAMRTVRRYIERVKTAWAATANAEQIERRRAELDAIARAAMHQLALDGKPIGVLRGAEFLAKLWGVEAPKRVEVTGGAGAAVAIQVVMTAEERDALARDKGGE
jgi:hypothetical protein